MGREPPQVAWSSHEIHSQVKRLFCNIRRLYLAAAFVLIVTGLLPVNSFLTPFRALMKLAAMSLPLQERLDLLTH